MSAVKLLSDEALHRRIVRGGLRRAGANPELTRYSIQRTTWGFVQLAGMPHCSGNFKTGSGKNAYH